MLNYTERCLTTGEDWEYTGTCIPEGNDRLIVHTFRHRCATASKNGAKDFNRSHSMHADRSLYINIPASASYTRAVRSERSQAPQPALGARVCVKSSTCNETTGFTGTLTQIINPRAVMVMLDELPTGYDSKRVIYSNGSLEGHCSRLP